MDTDHHGEEYEIELPIGEYKKGVGNGEGLVVNFKLKPDQIDVLNELVTAMPEMNRSDCLRAMVIPYLDALLLAKDGKKWQGALKFGKGFVQICNEIEVIHKESRQEEFDWNRGTVGELPSGI